MKYIKNYKLFETGEWSRGVNWQYTKDNPDDDCEEANWIRSLEKDLNEVIDFLDDPKLFQIIDIRGFDMYQGPYATVKILGRNYRVISVDYPDIPGLKIEDFPIDNCSEHGYNPGFMETEYEIAELLNGISRAGGIDMYLTVQKYNIL